MSLKQALIDAKVDEIEDDQEWHDKDMEVTLDYLYSVGFNVTEEDMEVFNSRNDPEYFDEWKRNWEEEKIEF